MTSSALPFFSAKTERIKAIDVHPTLPLVACALYNGQVTLWDISRRTQLGTMTIGKSIPIRAVCFVEAIDAVICGADDNFCYVFHYKTMERLRSFQGHMDYIRCLAVSTAAQLVFSGGDDARICVWDWANSWNKVKTLEAHQNYVMSLAMSPNDPFLFCSASLDSTVRIWGIQTAKTGFTVPTDARCLLRHPSGVNCAIFHPESGPTLPFIVTGADDYKVRIWDYHNRSCVYTIAEHTDCVTSLAFVYSVQDKHWVLLSGSEDEFLNTHETRSYQLVRRRRHSGGRVWALQATGANGKTKGAPQPTQIMAIIGSDNELTFEGPRRKTQTTIGVDVHNGQVVFNSQEELFHCDVKSGHQISPTSTEPLEASEIIARPIASLDSPVTSIQFDGSSQFIAFTTLDGYAIYSTLSWRHCASGECYGEAQKCFAWGPSVGQLVLLTAQRCLHLFENFQQVGEHHVDCDVQSVFIGANGVLFGVVHADSRERKGTVSIYEWGSKKRVKAVCFGESIREIIWNPEGSRIAVVRARSICIVDWERNYAKSNSDPFSRVNEIDVEAQESPQWVDNDTLFYLNDFTKRVEYILHGKIHCAIKGNFVKHIGGVVSTEGTSDARLHFYGYLPKESKVYFVDRPSGARPNACAVYFAEFPLAVLAFQKCLAMQPIDEERLVRIAGHIPAEFHVEMAAYCIDAKEPAMARKCFPAVKDESQFEAVLALNDFSLAHSIAQKLDDTDRWEQLGTETMKFGEFTIAAQALTKAKSYTKLLVLYASIGETNALRGLYETACREGNDEVAFSAAHCASDFPTAQEVLLRQGLYADAAAYSMKYCGESTKTREIVGEWRAEMASRAEDSHSSNPAILAGALLNLERMVNSVNGEERGHSVVTDTHKAHAFEDMFDSAQIVTDAMDKIGMDGPREEHVVADEISQPVTLTAQDIEGDADSSDEKSSIDVPRGTAENQSPEKEPRMVENSFTFENESSSDEVASIEDFESPQEPSIEEHIIDEMAVDVSEKEQPAIFIVESDDFEEKSMDDGDKHVELKLEVDGNAGDFPFIASSVTPAGTSENIERRDDEDLSKEAQVLEPEAFADYGENEAGPTEVPVSVDVSETQEGDEEVEISSVEEKSESGSPKGSTEALSELADDLLSCSSDPETISPEAVEILTEPKCHKDVSAGPPEEPVETVSEPLVSEVDASPDEKVQSEKMTDVPESLPSAIEDEEFPSMTSEEPEVESQEPVPHIPEENFAVAEVTGAHKTESKPLLEKLTPPQRTDFYFSDSDESQGSVSPQNPPAQYDDTWNDVFE